MLRNARPRADSLVSVNQTSYFSQTNCRLLMEFPAPDFDEDTLQCNDSESLFSFISFQFKLENNTLTFLLLI